MSSLRHRFPGARDGWARFDGPAGTQVVDSAITAMTNWLSDGSNGCGGGYFAAALKADELMERARATVGRLFNADPAGIAFGANMTSITFALSRAIGATLQPGDRIIGSGDPAEAPPNFKQCLPCREAWAEGEVGSEVHPDVEDAALGEGIGPLLSECCPYPGTTIADHDQRRRNLFQECLPCSL